MEFEELLSNPKQVSPVDTTDATKGAWAIVRKYELLDEDGEFYPLALDVGLSQCFAKSVRDAVKQVH